MIMLLDDDEDDQLIFKTAIDEIAKDIDCVCMSNAIRCIESLKVNKSAKPDCIFLDLNMPIMDGFDFLQTIKGSEDFNDIPVIIFSTSSRESDKVKAKELGAINFLSKPSSYSELKDNLARLLNTIYTS